MLVVFNLEEICFLYNAWFGSVAIKKGSDQWTPCYFSLYFVKELIMLLLSSVQPRIIGVYPTPWPAQDFL